MTRPTLDTHLSADSFLRWYWLKAELVVFCRSCGLSASGSKQALTGRIAKYLETGQSSRPTGQKSAKKDRMPRTFARATIIGSGWTCSQALRAFFEQELGRSFHFDATLREFIHQGQGKTLRDAIQAWDEARYSPVEKEIAPQFEYNRHIRDYLKTNPGAGLKAAIAAWKERRQKPMDDEGPTMEGQ